MSGVTAEYLRSILRYDIATGELYWRERTNVPAFWNSRYAGKRAGGVNGDGYMVVRINNVNYQAHRLIWIMETGHPPSECIDHINGHKTDNRIGNLRPATRAENNRNVSLRLDNRTGAKGVSWAVREKKWRARIKVNGKNKTLGYFNSIRAASDAYRKAASELHGEFARAS